MSQPINVHSLESWRESLSPRDVEVVNAVVGDVSRSCGYPVDPAPAPGVWRRVVYFADGQAMALVRLVGDVRHRRPLWQAWWRRWRLGTFWSSVSDFVAGR